MQRSIYVVGMISLFWIPAIALGASDSKETDGQVAAIVESTLLTDADHIRQLAFDGDPGTYFASKENPTSADSFTLTFDRPVVATSVSVATGTPSAENKLDKGNVEVSQTGKDFELLSTFTDGNAKAQLDHRKIVAIRIHPTEDMKHPLAIQEIKVESTPQVAIFKYPVEFVVDVSDAPEMQEWADKCARVCERAYTMINEELPSDGFKPAHLVKMTLKKDYRGVAATGGTRITGAVSWFKRHPDDVGAMVHETVHVVQAYRYGRGGNRNPGWLVEGIADYIRFFKYEPGKAGPVKADRHFDGSYRVTATFLNYVSEKYDKELVRKLNAAMREGKYSDDLFKDATGKTLQELDDEWRATLKS